MIDARRAQAIDRRTIRGRSLSARVLIAGCVVAAVTVLSGCSNSILGNAAEAGLETVLDTPPATPTRGTHP